MERDEAVEELPESYAQALRLRHEGLPDAAIAIRLGLPTASARSLLHLAEAKLAHLLATGDGRAEDEPA